MYFGLVAFCHTYNILEKYDSSPQTACKVSINFLNKVSKENIMFSVFIGDKDS